MDKQLWKQYDDVLGQLPVMRSPLELNYVITQICIRYFMIKPDKERFQTMNDIAGALSCATMEFYQRLAKVYGLAEQRGESTGP